MCNKKAILLLLLSFCILAPCYQAAAQNVFNDAYVIRSGSDNTGGEQQVGTEIIKSTPGLGVVFENGSTFEHVGQFYIAEDGIWNHRNSYTGSTDYFGYAPAGSGAYLPYRGVGIKGASPNNGGRGAGKPTFGNLVLNSTGVFPVVAGMYITSSLVFNANGPSRRNIITTPSVTTPDLPTSAVVFDPKATITGTNKTNYINGFASVTNVAGAFMLPLGDSTNTNSPLRTLTINNAVAGAVTARYLHTLQRSITALETGIDWVSPTGSWPISAPAGASITVSIPALNLLPEEAAYLRLVGWNGHQWVDLSKTFTPGSCVTGDCPLTGTLPANITDLAIGLSRNPVTMANLTVWPNPTQGPLYIRASMDNTLNDVQVLDQQGHSLLKPSRTSLQSGLDVSALPSGSYILEAHTVEGQILRQRFIRQ